MRAEFLIIGGGLAGTTLALELLERGRSVLVVDDANPAASSRVAAGLINPIVPKGVRKTWMCDTIFPALPAWYAKWEKQLNAQFYEPMNLIQIHPDERTAREWEKRSQENEYAPYLKAGEGNLPAEINAPFGYSIVHGGGRLNVQAFLDAAKQYLQQLGCVENDKIDYSQITIKTSSVWLNNMSFGAIVFCEGIQTLHNPWFNYLHFHPTGGDILTVKAENFMPTAKAIWKRKQWLVPEGNGHFLLGSNFHKGSLQEDPNPADAEKLLSDTRTWFKGELEIVEHRRGVRPTVEGRRPYLGKCKENSPVYIYNGLGSKGSSLVTLLSPMMADYLCEGAQLHHEVDIRRFEQEGN